MDNFEEKKLNYEKRIFVFIDILGFSQLVKESEFDNSKILRIYKLLESTKILATLPIGYKFQVLKVDLTKFRHHAFSDTIIMSCPCESYEYINAIIGWAENFQYFMLTEESTFVRGAIVYGNLIDDDNKSIMFGPALLAAYRLETHKAKWPRILVDNSVLEQMTAEKKVRAFKEHLSKGTNGITYIDYLRDLFAIACYKNGNNPKIFSDPMEILYNHKIVIEKAVISIMGISSEDKRQILKKYQQLSKYHNSVVNRLSEVTLKLQTNHNLVRNIQSEVMFSAIAKPRLKKLLKFSTIYTAKNIKYVDILPILGIAINRIIVECKDTMVPFNNDPVKIVNYLCSEAPEYLGELNQRIIKNKVDMNIFC
jgi:hypothetical protein